MIEIITPRIEPTPIFSRLYVGTIWTAKNLPERNPWNFHAVLNCTDETIPRQKDVAIVQLSLRDGEEVPASKLHYALRVLRDLMSVSFDRSVLICCHASQSRSPAMTVAYLVSIGMDWNEAEEFVKRAHPLTQIHPLISKSLRQHFGYAARSAQDFIQ